MCRFQRVVVFLNDTLQHFDFLGMGDVFITPYFHPGLLVHEFLHLGPDFFYISGGFFAVYVQVYPSVCRVAFCHDSFILRAIVQYREPEKKDRF